MSDTLRQLEKTLSTTFSDLILSAREKSTLATLASEIDEDQRRFLKNRAFDLCRSLLVDASSSNNEEQRRQCYRWLEKSIKALSVYKDTAPVSSQALFSPGTECKKRIISFCNNAKKSLDICVFTISDNQITDSIISAHTRGVNVRIISDNDKSEDRGSDIDFMQEKGLDIRLDQTDNHMHHKFAVIDQKILLNGSFNWTRSASERNEENVVSHYDTELIDSFLEKFEDLWLRYKK